MALGSMVDNKSGKNVKIVPAGLNYFKRDEFRSEVIIEFGKPFEVPSRWAEEFLVNKKEAADKLLTEIESRMKAVTLTAQSYEELRTLYLLRKIYVPKEIKLSPTQYSELCKKFIKAFKKLKEIPECVDLINRVNGYIREIDELGLTDSQLRDTHFHQKKMKRTFLLSTLLFFSYLLFLFPGLLIFYPFKMLISRTAEKERIKVSHLYSYF